MSAGAAPARDRRVSKKPPRTRFAAACLALTLLLGSPLPADYQAGLDAYSFGDYARAMAEWRAITDGPATAVEPKIYIEAHYAVAMLYWEGAGVPRDLGAAREWLQRAADMNHAGARAKLAYLYTDGVAVPQDFARAFELYSLAARQGDVDALYNLGVFYLNGWGTERDETLARQYLAAASAQGDAAAEEALQELLAREARAEPAESREPAAAAAAAEANPVREETTMPDPVAEARESPAPDPAAEATEPSAPDPAPGAEESPTADPAPGGSPAPLLAEPWILARDPAHYTLQVIALGARDKVEALVAGHPELAPWAIYTARGSKGTLHVLVQGDYPDVETARAARDAFPRAIQKPEEVWIRRFDKVQELIGAQR